jgi:hypothetical protein
LSQKKLASTAPACFGAPSRPRDARAHAYDEYRKQGAAKGAQRRHAACVEPDGSGGINAVAAGELLKDELASSRENSGGEQDANVAHCAAVLGSFYDVGCRTMPRKVLGEFQKAGQSGRAQPCAGTREQNSQPKLRGTRAEECRGDGVATRILGYGHR